MLKVMFLTILNLGFDLGKMVSCVEINDFGFDSKGLKGFLECETMGFNGHFECKNVLSGLSIQRGDLGAILVQKMAPDLSATAAAHGELSSLVAAAAMAKLTL